MTGIILEAEVRIECSNSNREKHLNILISFLFSKSSAFIVPQLPNSNSSCEELCEAKKYKGTYDMFTICIAAF